MKKFVFSLVLASSVASTPLLFAQDAASTSSPSTAAPSAGSKNPGSGNGQRAEKWKAIMEQLDLSDAQKVQIKQIRASTQPGPDRRHQIMAVLLPDQKQKLISLLKEAQAEQAGQ
jgi:Spy/CpxP family protein refolding chaperone